MKKEDESKIEEEQPVLFPVTIEEVQRKLEVCEMMHERNQERITRLLADCLNYSDLILKLDSERRQLEQLLKEEREKYAKLLEESGLYKY